MTGRPDTSFLDSIVKRRDGATPLVAPPPQTIGTDETARVRPLYVPSGSTDPVETEIPEDKPSGLLGAFLDLRLTLDGLRGQLAAQNQLNARLLDRLEKNTPVKVTRVGQVTAVSAGKPDWINLDGPDAGFFWSLESCCVAGTDINVASAVTQVGLYVVTSPPATRGGVGQGTSPGTGSLRDFGTSLPQVGTYGGRDVVLEDGDYLFIGLFGATAGQVYEANAVFSCYNVAAARGVTDNTAGF